MVRDDKVILLDQGICGDNPSVHNHQDSPIMHSTPHLYTKLVYHRSIFQGNYHRQCMMSHFWENRIVKLDCNCGFYKCTTRWQVSPGGRSDKQAENRHVQIIKYSSYIEMVFSYYLFQSVPQWSMPLTS